MPTRQELQQLQSLPLAVKIRKTIQRIKEWVDHFGIDGVYVSFSGGKDSTVLLHIVRQLYLNMKAAYVDTGLENPEIREFVRQYENVDWLKPKKNFKQVILEYGYPLISKEVAECVSGARKYLTKVRELYPELLTDIQTDSGCRIATGRKSLLELADMQALRAMTPGGGQITNIENSPELANILNDRSIKGKRTRTALLLGMMDKDNQIRTAESIPEKDRSMFAQTKYKFFLEAPFEISTQCCNILKKSPAHRYERKTKRMPITAQTAAESRLRTQKWLNNGCNGFNMKAPISNPMSFWTEQDILWYIRLHNLPICSVYGDILTDEEEESGERIYFDYETIMNAGLFERPALHTTGCKRTGCMFCLFGAHLERDFYRLQYVHENYPNIYDWIMKPVGEGGLGYKDVIDWTNEHGNLHIKY